MSPAYRMTFRWGCNPAALPSGGPTRVCLDGSDDRRYEAGSVGDVAAAGGVDSYEDSAPDLDVGPTAFERHPPWFRSQGAPDKFRNLPTSVRTRGHRRSVPRSEE